MGKRCVYRTPRQGNPLRAIFTWHVTNACFSVTEHSVDGLLTVRNITLRFSRGFGADLRVCSSFYLFDLMFPSCSFGTGMDCYCSGEFRSTASPREGHAGEGGGIQEDGTFERVSLSTPQQPVVFLPPRLPFLPFSSLSPLSPFACAVIFTT